MAGSIYQLQHGKRITAFNWQSYMVCSENLVASLGCSNGESHTLFPKGQECFLLPVAFTDRIRNILWNQIQSLVLIKNWMSLWSTIAEELNLSDSYIVQIERGERSVTLDTLEKLSNLLNINMGFLLLDLDKLSSKNDNIIKKLSIILAGKTTMQKEKLFNIISSVIDYSENLWCPWFM